MKTKILLADDHKIFRDGLRTLINMQSDMAVIGEADNGRVAVQLAAKLRPNVLIMDVSMPDMNGIEATRQVLRDVPGVKVIALSMHSDRRFVTGMLEAGAFGYLLKDCDFEELAKAVRIVVLDQRYLSPRATNVVIDTYIGKSDRPPLEASSSLTHREREILQLLAEGKMPKEIAFDLDVSVKTVDAHRRNIMQKLKIDNMADLVKYAIREGLTTVES